MLRSLRAVPPCRDAERRLMRSVGAASRAELARSVSSLRLGDVARMLRATSPDPAGAIDVRLGDALDTLLPMLAQAGDPRRPPQDEGAANE